MSGNYLINSGAAGKPDASSITFDNADVRLEARNVQDALAELREMMIQPVLSVTCNPPAAGITVAAKHGETTLTGTTDENGYTEITVDASGAWLVTAELDGEEITKLVAIGTAAVYRVELSRAYIYGVRWDGSASTVLARTDDSALFTDPVAATGDGSGYSPFDRLYPWSGMEEYNVIGGEIAYKRGDPLFSRADYDTVVKIPEFWYQRPDANTFRIADRPVAGFEKHPGSGRYVGKYLLSGNARTISGADITRSVTVGAVRNYAKGKGAGWVCHDFMSQCAIQALYIVEFADWNSRATIGAGLSSTTTGLTDSMVYHTGNVGGATQYRHIEGLIGPKLVSLDGAYVQRYRVYICENPLQYSDSEFGPYMDSGVSLPNVSYDTVTSLGYSTRFPWAVIPETASGGSRDTYIPDYVFNGSDLSSVKGLNASGYTSANYGMFLFGCPNALTFANNDNAGRMLFDPSLKGVGV